MVELKMIPQAQSDQAKQQSLALVQKAAGRAGELRDGRRAAGGGHAPE